jgi:hypothetical protein
MRSRFVLPYVTTAVNVRGSHEANFCWTTTCQALQADYVGYHGTQVSKGLIHHVICYGLDRIIIPCLSLAPLKPSNSCQRLVHGRWHQFILNPPFEHPFNASDVLVDVLAGVTLIHQPLTNHFEGKRPKISDISSAVQLL